MNVEVTGLAYCAVMAVLLIAAARGQTLDEIRDAAGGRGVCVFWPVADEDLVLRTTRETQMLVLAQLAHSDAADRLRRRAERAGLLGARLFVAEGGGPIQLADNLADVVVLGDAAVAGVDSRHEALRVLHPGGRALGAHQLVKPRPAGADDWSHPYHGPDNNPLSSDQQARAPYLTQFLCEPWYVPMPQVTVASGGRVFKAFGHIALKQREWPWLNTLVAINGYNGTQLWRRKLRPGFMIHRNTLIATPDTLYLADDTSCKLLDAATGDLRGEIKVDPQLDADGVWKWMALSDGVLYALAGPRESPEPAVRGRREQPGWPWSELGAGYAGQYSWGFGRTLLAIDPASGRVRWSRQFDDPIDSRATCLAADRVFLYSHLKFLAALDADTGEPLWRTSDPQVMQAIGEHDRAQNPRQGFASSAYAKANQHGIYFAGPQRKKLAAVSAADGSLLWEYPHGNFQLVLRDDALYALGRTETSKKFDYVTGKLLADLQCYRGNCTRATGSVDSIFTRGYRHTGTMRLDVASNDARRIALMRPACQDGVVVADGMLYWGPWMCDCNHSLVGTIGVAPAGDCEFEQAGDCSRLTKTGRVVRRPLAADQNDWTSYRGDASRSAKTAVEIPARVKLLWQTQAPSQTAPAAPLAAAGLAIWSGLDGVVRAVDIQSGEPAWTAYTGGEVRFPPELDAGGRLLVGSGDGHVYCFDAATGERLWRFQAAPALRRIVAHGRLLSNWPVGSGVLVHDSVVYAAAGLTSYDGTHVYALDTASGEIRWQNNSSGSLDQATGVSVQGHLLLHDGQLYMSGGNVISPAVYDLQDGRCLNELSNAWWRRSPEDQERFPSRPQTEMFHRSPRGRELFVVDGEVRVFDQLLYSPPRYGPSRYFGGHFLQAGRGKTLVRATTGRLTRIASQAATGGQPVGLWVSDMFRDPLALAVTGNAVLVAGELAKEEAESSATYALAALNPQDGSAMWSYDLPAQPCPWGLAVDHKGHVVVTLQDGQAVCFGP